MTGINRNVHWLVSRDVSPRNALVDSVDREMKFALQRHKNTHCVAYIEGFFSPIDIVLQKRVELGKRSF